MAYWTWYSQFRDELASGLLDLGLGLIYNVQSQFRDGLGRSLLDLGLELV